MILLSLCSLDLFQRLRLPRELALVILFVTVCYLVCNCTVPVFTGVSTDEVTIYLRLGKVFFLDT